MYGIRPLADGYGIYKDDVYIMWCYSYEFAQHRIEELMSKQKDTV